MFIVIPLIEKMVNCAAGASSYATRTFCLEMISQNSLRSLPICGRGFTCQMFCTDEIQILSGD